MILRIQNFEKFENLHYPTVSTVRYTKLSLCNIELLDLSDDYKPLLQYMEQSNTNEPQ